MSSPIKWGIIKTTVAAKGYTNVTARRKTLTRAIILQIFQASTDDKSGSQATVFIEFPAVQPFLVCTHSIGLYPSIPPDRISRTTLLIHGNVAWPCVCKKRCRQWKELPAR